jgi:hypothetical protein
VGGAGFVRRDNAVPGGLPIAIQSGFHKSTRNVRVETSNIGQCSIQPTLNTTNAQYNQRSIQPTLNITSAQYNQRSIQPALNTTRRKLRRIVQELVLDRKWCKKLHSKDNLSLNLPKFIVNFGKLQANLQGVVWLCTEGIGRKNCRRSPQKDPRVIIPLCRSWLVSMGIPGACSGALLVWLNCSHKAPD